MPDESAAATPGPPDDADPGDLPTDPSTERSVVGSAAREDPAQGMRRRRFLGLAAGGVVLAGAAGTVWARSRSTSSGVSASSAPSTTRRPQELRVTPVTEPPLPIPDALPDPDAPSPQVVLGTIAIDRLGLHADLQEGMALADIDRGPSHWPGTALPGQLGNLVVAGHRTTFTEPFRHLELLQPGDPVRFVVNGITSTYLVRGVVVVPANAVDIAAQSRAHTATLFACHPPGLSSQRIVAKLRLVDATGQPVEADSVLPPLDDGAQAGDHVLTVQLPSAG